MGYFSILTAIPGFFLSSFFFMLLWGVIARNFGVDIISYQMAILATITLWLVVVPLAVATDRRGGKSDCFILYRDFVRWRN